MSDNAVVVGAFSKKASPVWSINCIVERVFSTFPNLSLSFQHVAGEVNPADPLSRGVPMTNEDWDNWRDALDV